MHVDQVIASLAFQIEYLKDKLETIREIADEAYNDGRQEEEIHSSVMSFIHILNLCDEVEVYNDKRDSD